VTVTARWLPLVFGLRANFPNPFNPSTTIGYSLPTDVKVRLAIFDVLGQKVRTLVREEQPAGFHLAVWDSRNDAGHRVAAGVSLLQAGGPRRRRRKRDDGVQ